ncbi:hypothetical protein BAE44_0022660 [Dichanthelium oligosanthes]|uniref:MADS-box domain-containing protein n=1 Tax=Dichanthelium oligosanthes TaxID=888268 RepID=A0A1E5UTT7_9POAL|nr:hypothetical protein BAE44_0022660 [Dichanthelium oligosanthes]
MTRGKGGPMRAAVSPHERLAWFARRKETLRKKAEELGSLCGVDVAVVCTDPGGAGDPYCWPSREAASAVARRYSALEPAERAKHTEDHAAHVVRRLAEERDKLARVREGGVAGALGSWDGSLEGVSEEKLRELLASIEGSLVAAKNRVLKLQAPLGGAADRATFLPGLVHEDEATEEDSVSATDNGVPPRPQPRCEADAGGGGGLGPPRSKNPNSANAAVPVDADEEVVAENIVTAEDAGDEVQILQPPGDADPDDAEWMRGLVDDLKKRPQPYNPAGYAAGIEYINVGRFLMERDAYDFIRFDLGMPPPCIEPNSPDDDGEPLKLWSWVNTMPPP